ncbi:MAG: hypothetical protein H6832_06950 [Planctomycetes bacterium]|nr:hypothetical protein [Planctomycetota bacterium]MCB9918125.1 hypothetical protein [Planctomycetota bacterium]
MRRRTTILDVLREDRGEQEELRAGRSQEPHGRRTEATESAAVDPSWKPRESTPADADEPRSRRRNRRGNASESADQRSSVYESAETASDERSTRSQASRRRRRYRDDEDVDGSANETQTPTETRAALPSREPVSAPPSPKASAGPRRRTTLASGRRPGLRFAEWMQDGVEMPRGYLVAAALAVCACLALVFWLGRFSVDRVDDDGTNVAGLPEQNRPQPMHQNDGNDPNDGGTKPIADSVQIDSGTTAGFNVVTYDPSATNRNLLRALHDHMKAQGIRTEGLTRRSSDGKSETWVLAALLPRDLVGDKEATRSFFERLRGLPAPDPKFVRFDFQKLEFSPIAWRDLPESTRAGVAPDDAAR